MPRNKKEGRPSDTAVLEELLRECAAVTRKDARIVQLLVDVEDRSLHLLEGCSSIYDFCLNRLGMSEGAAYLRMTSARLVRRFPTLAGYLERGEIDMSKLALLRDHLTEENVDAMIAATRGKSKMQVKELLAAKSPGPVKPSSLRKLPTVKTANDIAPVAPRHIEPVTESRYRFGLTVTREQRDEVLYVRDLVMHRIPSGDLTELVMDGIARIRRDAERELFGGPSTRERPVPGTRPRPPAPPTKALKKVPRRVRREVFARDGHRCTYSSAKGHRCPATAFLELDHIIPVARGGMHDPDNLRVRCYAHNKLYAELVYGAEYVRRKIHLSQLKSTQPKAAPTNVTGVAAKSSLNGARAP